MEELKCPICGEHTRVYMGNARKDKLCGKHADMLKNGEIEINDEGLFIDVETKSILNMDYMKEIKKLIVEDDGITRCITCGRETKPGYFFCPFCYNKYNNKVLLIKISKCREFEVLDDSYEGHYTCDDGHIVKSKSEREIDNYLFENGIPHAYEKTYVSEDDREIKPDFTLPNYNNSGKDVLLEHWGYNENNIEYTN